MNELQIIEYNNQRVLTTQQLAECYETTSDVVTKNFNRNKERYEKGKHYHLLQGGYLKEFRASGQIDLLPNIHKVYLWTERGAFLHAKSLNTDKAWELYDELIEHYFKSSKALNLNGSPMKMLKMMFSGMEELESRIDVLENDRTISQSEYTEIGTKIKNRINEVIKEEHIPVTRKQRQKLFHEFNHDVLIVGGVKHRNQIKKKDYYKVLDFINDWKPSRATVVGILGYEQTRFRY